jgi:CBS domain-containing protein
MTATTRDLLAMKNSAVVVSCSPETTVSEACLILRDRSVGCLVVLRGAEVQGIFSERDVVARIVAQGLDASSTRVKEVMARPVSTVTLDTRCGDLETLLRQRRVRHLPVVGARGLLGVVSLGDVARFYAARERSLAEASGAPIQQ